MSVAVSELPVPLTEISVALALLRRILFARPVPPLPLPITPGACKNPVRLLEYDPEGPETEIIKVNVPPMPDP
jgi:hypothetical protein